VHTPVAVSQARFVEHSDAAVQPPHVPFDLHAVPEALPTHETHFAPVTPQAAGAFPGSHVPPLQQPSLQG
jgi:hypothetical protein